MGKNISSLPQKLTEKKMLQYFVKFIERFDAIKFVLTSQKEELLRQKKQIEKLEKEIQKTFETKSSDINGVLEKTEKLDKLYKKLRFIFKEHTNNFSKEHKKHKKQLHTLKRTQNILTERIYTPKDEEIPLIKENKGFYPEQNISQILQRNNKDISEIKEFVKISLNDFSNRFRKLFQTELLAFDTQIKQKEEKLTIKIISLEEERSKLNLKFQKYREDMSELVKEQNKKLKNDFNKIKDEEDIIFQKKESVTKEFLNQANNLLSNQKQQVENFFKEQKEQHDIQENTFKELFSQKINNLYVHLNEKTQLIEKKLLDKNLPIIESE